MESFNRVGPRLLAVVVDVVVVTVEVTVVVVFRFIMDGIVVTTVVVLVLVVVVMVVVVEDVEVVAAVVEVVRVVVDVVVLAGLRRSRTRRVQVPLSVPPSIIAVGSAHWKCCPLSTMTISASSAHLSPT
jgi:hypothetical protein